MKKLLLLFYCCFLFKNAGAQITVTLPCAKDAAFGYHDGASTGNTNDGNAAHSGVAMVPSVASSVGFNCVRTIMAFNLGSIPATATIVSAAINLYAYGPFSIYAGHFGPANTSYLQRVTQPWGELTVTWNNQPTTVTQNQVILPQSTSGSQNYLNVDVTTLVQDMINNPSTSDGFLFRLANEAITNGMYFCSRNHSNIARHPTLVITYNTCVTQAVTASSQPNVICSGQPVTMSSSGGGNTNWFTSPTSQVTVTSGPALITSTLSATAAPSVYTFYAASNSCVSNPRTPVTVTVNPRPAINLAISDTVICAGNAVSLYAAGATNYTWSSGTQVIALSSSAVVTPAVSALYQVSGSNIYGCTNINSIHVTVHPLPVLVAGANPTLLCAGTASSATLYAFGAASYTWSDGQQVIAQVPAAVAFPTVTTIYQLTGSTANGCSSNSLVQVTVQRCDDVGFHKEITAVQLVNIYPNPSDGTLKITAGQNTVFDRIELSDLQGRTISVYALPVAGNTYELKNSTLTPGVYFCEIKSGSKTLSLKKIIITD